jgi:hypothetical protein
MVVSFPQEEILEDGCGYKVQLAKEIAGGWAWFVRDEFANTLAQKQDQQKNLDHRSVLNSLEGRIDKIGDGLPGSKNKGRCMEKGKVRA